MIDLRERLYSSNKTDNIQASKQSSDKCLTSIRCDGPSRGRLHTRTVSAISLLHRHPTDSRPSIQKAHCTRKRGFKGDLFGLFLDVPSSPFPMQPAGGSLIAKNDSAYWAHLSTRRIAGSSTSLWQAQLERSA